MEFAKPVPKGYTIYTKSGCSFCQKLKSLLTDLEIPYVVIDCDKYLETREEFLEFIKITAKKEYKTFPMVFYDGMFVGGYMEILKSDGLFKD